MGRSMFAVLANLVCNEDGATAIEYSVIGALITIAVATSGIALMPLMAP
jgi:Flp pilus assembly pilin Flp